MSLLLPGSRVVVIIDSAEVNVAVVTSVVSTGPSVVPSDVGVCSVDDMIYS